MSENANVHTTGTPNATSPEHMSLLSIADNDAITYHFLNTISFPVRLFSALALILLGLAVEYFVRSYWYAGLPLILAGSLLMRPRGIVPRLDLKGADMTSAWEPTTVEKLDDIIKHSKNAERASNKIGTLDIFLALGAYIILPIMLGYSIFFGKTVALTILSVNAMILLFPQRLWSGLSSIKEIPVVARARIFKWLLQKEKIDDLSLEVMLLLRGAERKAPADVKFKVDFPEKNPDILGLYVQLVMNSVRDKKYPYLYSVLVARKGYPMKERFGDYKSPRKDIITEFKKAEGGVEVMILRQKTTKTSGYHTSYQKMHEIYREGLDILRKAK